MPRLTRRKARQDGKPVEAVQGLGEGGRVGRSSSGAVGGRTRMVGRQRPAQGAGHRIAGANAVQCALDGVGTCLTLCRLRGTLEHAVLSAAARRCAVACRYRYVGCGRTPPTRVLYSIECGDVRFFKCAHVLSPVAHTMPSRLSEASASPLTRPEIYRGAGCVRGSKWRGASVLGWLAQSRLPVCTIDIAGQLLEQRKGGCRPLPWGTLFGGGDGQLLFKVH